MQWSNLRRDGYIQWAKKIESLIPGEMEEKYIDLARKILGGCEHMEWGAKWSWYAAARGYLMQVARDAGWEDKKNKAELITRGI